MTITVLSDSKTCSVPFAPGQTVLDAVRAFGGLEITAPCGGRGSCRKCMVLVGERQVLACQTPAEQGMTVRIPEQGELAVALSQKNLVKSDRRRGFGIACDIGTTTVVCSLVDLATGEIRGTLGRGNHQRSYGADVISRIEASMAGKCPEMTRCIRSQLSDMIRELCDNEGISPETVGLMTVAANAVMCHLLAGLQPDSMGHAPYEPLSRFGTWFSGAELDLPIAGKVYVIPGASGYVGGDITADILALGLERETTPALLIDVGTNGEMALGCGDKFLCCSTAAGPAFEGEEIVCGMTAGPGAISEVRWEHGALSVKTIGGGTATGICGSGLIDALAVMLDLGALDETGRMLDPEEDEIPMELEPCLGVFADAPAFYLTDDVFVTQADVRKVQLGKGAIAAGVSVLRQYWQGGEIGALLLAGGFGSFIRPESAARIGLIPYDLLPVTRAVGNTASQGALEVLCRKDGDRRALEIRDTMEVLELTGLDAFRDAYIGEMMFPEEE